MCFSILKIMLRKDWKRVNFIEELRKWSEKNIDLLGFNISLFENKGKEKFLNCFKLNFWILFGD